jgi:hypothetical protein
MTSPSATPTPITPPRVPLIDERTGLIDRAWYMFFLSLFNAASNNDLAKSPDANSALATYDALLRAVQQAAETQRSDSIQELQQAVDALRQEVQTIPRVEPTPAVPASSAPTLNIVTGTTQAATAGNHYVLTNVAATTLTLPATPGAGDLVWVTVGNGLTTNIVARNGSNIQSLAEDLTLNAAYAAVQMRFINSTIGWTFV